MKKRQQDSYREILFPQTRRVLEIMYPSVQRKPMIHGLLELDVTRAREFLRNHKRKTGESLSFTAFIITCFAHAIGENPSLHAYPRGNKRLVIFDDVDVATPIEREMDGKKQPVIFIVRAANKKTFREIHHEIRAAQAAEIKDIWEGFASVSRWQFLPMPFFRLGWSIFCWLRHHYPQIQKKYGGTVGVTAIGMFGKRAGWGIPLNDHTIDLTLGGITEKPGIVSGQIAIREYLCLTLSLNHAFIDGAPAARFAEQLRKFIEDGYGLDAGESESESEGSTATR